MPNTISEALLLALRREQLCKRAPSCPKCQEARQIQLREWLVKPAIWRCRMCHHIWEFEPA